MYNQTTSAIIQLETHDCPMSPRPRHLLMKTNRTGSLGGEAGTLQLCGRFCQRDVRLVGEDLHAPRPEAAADLGVNAVGWGGGLATGV